MDTVHLALTQVIVNGTLSSTLRSSKLGAQVSAYLLAFQPGFGEHNPQYHSQCHRLLLHLACCTQPQPPACECLCIPWQQQVASSGTMSCSDGRGQRDPQHEAAHHACRCQFVYGSFSRGHSHASTWPLSCQILSCSPRQAQLHILDDTGCCACSCQQGQVLESTVLFCLPCAYSSNQSVFCYSPLFCTLATTNVALSCIHSYCPHSNNCATILQPPAQEPARSRPTLWASYCRCAVQPLCTCWAPSPHLLCSSQQFVVHNMRALFCPFGRHLHSTMHRCAQHPLA